MARLSEVEDYDRGITWGEVQGRDPRERGLWQVPLGVSDRPQDPGLDRVFVEAVEAIKKFEGERRKNPYGDYSAPIEVVKRWDHQSGMSQVFLQPPSHSMGIRRHFNLQLSEFEEIAGAVSSLMIAARRSPAPKKHR